MIVVLAAVLVMAGACAYSTSFDGVLVLDDIRAIARNPTIRSFSSALQPPGESTVAGRPVANLSLALNYALAPAGVRDRFVPGGPGDAEGARAVAENLWGYHLLNLVIHVAAGLVLFGVLRRTLASRRLAPVFDAAPAGAGLRAVPASAWLAFVVALIWLVHPLQTEAVTYLVQRVEALMGLFLLLTVYCSIRASEAVGRGAWTAAAVASCALGMGTKEVMVVAPLLVFLWDRLFLAGEGGRAGRGRLVLYAGLAATWMVLALLVLNEHRAASVDVGQGMTWRYLATQAGVIVHYLRLVIVPGPLVFLYTWPLESSLTGVAPQALLLAGLGVLTVLGFVRRHPLAMPGAWFLLILAPTSSLLPIVTEVAAEHRMYLPLAAVLACLVVGVFLAGRRLAARVSAAGPERRRVVRPLLAAAALSVVGVAGVFGAMTRERNQDYWSDERLWQTAVEAQPSNQRARVAYGMALFGRGRVADAETHLRAAVDLSPADPVARGRLGAVLAAQGRFDEAIVLLRRAADLTAGRDVQLLMVLASAQAQGGRLIDAAATATAAAHAARAQGRTAIADELARRAAAYEAMARR